MLGMLGKTQVSIYKKAKVNSIFIKLKRPSTQHPAQDPALSLLIRFNIMVLDCINRGRHIGSIFLQFLCLLPVFAG